VRPNKIGWTLTNKNRQRLGGISQQAGNEESQILIPVQESSNGIDGGDDEETKLLLFDMNEMERIHGQS
jgi:hypothetical protein